MLAIPRRVLKSLDYLICLFFTLFLLKSCEKATAPFKPTIISLKPEYVGVTDADLRLTIKNLELPIEFQLIRNDSLVVQGSLTTTDTLLRDTLLLQAHSYSYQAILLKETNRISQSEKVGLTTMDTTSHEFQWETFTFGFGAGSSHLTDVAINNDSDIWAVGEIHTPETDRFDSLGNWVDPYNAVHWDGQHWELLRVPYIYHGSPVISPLKWIYSFDSQNIWFGNSVYWDGQHFQNVDIAISIFSGIGINKMWGSSNGEMYVVGNQGIIAYSYDVGRTWIQLESGTDLPIQDIWGTRNERTGEYEILCVASRRDQNEGRELLKITTQGVEKLQTERLSWSLEAIWFIPDRIYYIGGDGLYLSRNLNAPWKRDNSFPLLYKHAIRGQAINDIIVAGSFGLLSHFNGVNWRHYNGGNFPSTRAEYWGVAIHENMIIAVGYYNLRDGLVVVGRRN